MISIAGVGGQGRKGQSRRQCKPLPLSLLLRWTGIQRAAGFEEEGRAPKENWDVFARVMGMRLEHGVRRPRLDGQRACAGDKTEWGLRPGVPYPWL
jgi:hypothetical protein